MSGTLVMAAGVSAHSCIPRMLLATIYGWTLGWCSQGVTLVLCLLHWGDSDVVLSHFPQARGAPGANSPGAVQFPPSTSLLWWCGALLWAPRSPWGAAALPEPRPEQLGMSKRCQEKLQMPPMAVAGRWCGQQLGWCLPRSSLAPPGPEVPGGTQRGSFIN